MRKTKKQQGYIILILAIIVTSIGALVAANNLTLSTDNLRLTGGNQDSAEASNLSATCVEVALSKFRENRNYPGNEEIIIDEGEDGTEGTSDDVTCQILTVAPGQNGQRIFHTVSSDGTFTKYREVSLRSTDPNIVVEYTRTIPTLQGTDNEYHPFITGSYSSMLMWLTARSIANDGNTATSISTWEDLSPNNITVEQTTPGQRPSYQENGPSGMPTVSFDGVDDWLSTNLNLPETDYSAIVIFESTDTSGPFITAVNPVSPTAPSHDRQFGLLSGNLQQRVYALENINSTSTYNNSQPYISLATLGSNGQYIYVNGVQVAAGIKQSSDFTWDTGTIIGGHAFWGYLNGNISEIIIFDSELTPTERTEIFDYLGDIYGITVN